MKTSCVSFFGGTRVDFFCLLIPKDSHLFFQSSSRINGICPHWSFQNRAPKLARRRPGHPFAHLTKKKHCANKDSPCTENVIVVVAAAVVQILFGGIIMWICTYDLFSCHVLSQYCQEFPGSQCLVYSNLDQHLSWLTNISRIINRTPTSWWFQPIWKILVKLDHFPK